MAWKNVGITERRAQRTAGWEGRAGTFLWKGQVGRSLWKAGRGGFSWRNILLDQWHQKENTACGRNLASRYRRSGGCFGLG